MRLKSHLGFSFILIQYLTKYSNLIILMDNKFQPTIEQLKIQQKANETNVQLNCLNCSMFDMLVPI